MTTDADTLLLGFTRALRSAGVAVTQDRAVGYLAAVAALGAGDPVAVRRAGRATLCSGPEDLLVHDRVFEAWFLGDDEPGRPREQPAPVVLQAPFGEDDPGAGGAEEGEVLQVAASDAEVLRHRDIATMDAAERARLAQLFRRLEPVPPRRTSYRRVAARRGSVDAHATLRRTLHRLGEPVEIAHRRRSVRARRVVLLIDVSGSMSSYADALLRLAHRISTRGRTEVFSVGTRVTRLTRPMRQREADRAIIAAGETVPDWSGGTRLGEGVKVFLDRWGQRGMVRGAVVVIFSDGWERGDARLLGEQMARLHRLAHAVVWVNPHKGAAGYEPVQQGMAAALPYVDHFVAGHSLAAFRHVVEVIGDA